MNATMESKFKPYESPSGKDFSSATVKDPNADTQDPNVGKNRTSFKDLILNSNEEMARDRAAQKNGDALRAAKTDAEFSKMMVEKANQSNMRKPQNELDKDSFLKLFVAQMRNQDPLSPDNSTQMAAQLAQFHGLEQMMNVNKNLEKMQGDNATSRGIAMLNFVGKEIKLDNGKLQVQGGHIATDATVKVPGDAVRSILEVRDSSGTVVASQDMGPLQAGEHKIEWDAVDNEGRRLGDGTYTFALVATGEDGQAVDARISSTVRVTGVDLHDQGGAFYTPIGKVGIGEVASVGDAGFTKEVMKAVDAAPAVDNAAASAAAAAAAAEAAMSPPIAPAKDAGPAKAAAAEHAAEARARKPEAVTGAAQAGKAGAETENVDAAADPTLHNLASPAPFMLPVEHGGA